MLIIYTFSLFLLLNLTGNAAYFVQAYNDPPVVPQPCVGCICEVMTGCKEESLKCTNDVCGPFQMTTHYWGDAGEPKLTDVRTEFKDCANDVFCAAKALQGYMRKYGMDCNDDNVTNCYDYLAIHKLGSKQCGNFFVGREYDAPKRNLEKCLTNVKADEFRQTTKPKR